MTRFACFEGNLLAADINKEADLKFIWSRYMHCDFQSYSNKTWWRICSSGLRDTWDALTSHDAEQSAQGCVVLHLSHQGCATEWETAVTPSHQQSPPSPPTTPAPPPPLPDLSTWHCHNTTVTEIKFILCELKPHTMPSERWRSPLQFSNQLILNTKHFQCSGAIYLLSMYYNL